MSEPSGQAQAMMAPPGWYVTAWGWQWWDGWQWGPLAQPAPSSPANEKTLALLAHLSAILGGVVVSGVIFAISEHKPFARYHAGEALNLSLTFMIVQVPLSLLFMVGFVSSMGTGSDAGFAVGFGSFAVALLLMSIVSVAHIGFAIVAAMKANNLEYYRYPIAIRFIKHPLPEEMTERA